ncbi:MAG: hypothetical protein WC683_09325 [bacterium]|jgi:hypothetical protein
MKIKVTKGQSFRSLLIDVHACHEAREWVGRKSLRCAYHGCKRAEWILWLAGRLGVDRKVLVFAACQCARTALQYVKAGETRPLKAIETAEAWCRGDAGVAPEDVRKAAAAANAAAYYAASAADAAASAAASAAYYAASAADAAANAASAAAYAAYAAAAAANAASAAAYAAYAAARGSPQRSAARAEALARCAELVLQHVPLKAIEDAIAKRRAP